MSRLFLPAATNYCTHPSFELDANSDGLSDGISYNKDSGDPTPTRVAGRTGGFAQRLQYTGAGGEAGKYFDAWLGNQSAAASFTAGDVVTLSLWAKGSLTGCVSSLHWYAYTDVPVYVNNATSAITLTSSWARYSFTFTVPATATRIWCALTCGSIDAGDTVDVTFDDVLIEKSAIVTPYFDGATSDSLNASTYAWTGAANASTSTRANSVLALPISIPASGTIAMRYAPLWAAASGYVHQLVALGGAPSWSSVIVSATGSLAGYYHNGTSLASITGAAQNFTAGTVHAGTFRFVPGASLDLMFDGTAVAQAAHALTAATWTSAEIGSNTSQPPTTYVGPVLISPQRKSDAWVTAVDALLRATTVDIPTLKRVYMAPGDALFTGNQADGSNLYVKGS